MSTILLSVLVGFCLLIAFAIFMAISDRKIVQQRAKEDQENALKEARENTP